MVNRLRLLREVWQEMNFQKMLHPNESHDLPTWLAILMEEVGEAATAVFECDTPQYRAELLQVAAVALRIVSVIDRRKR